MTVAVDIRCTGCGACLATCPERALLAAPRHPVVLHDRCTTCLACVEVCPADAISPVTGTRLLRTTPVTPGGDTNPAGPTDALPGTRP